MASREGLSMLMGDLLKIPGNEFCVDCGQLNPQWVSCTFGVLMCETCASYHDMVLGPESEEVKSIADLSSEQIEKLKSKGNILSKQIYEKHVPPCYRRPKPKDPEVLLEQWIRAKYERREFMWQNDHLPYLKDHREGYLWKQGKGSRQFNRRRFVLDALANRLIYFNKEGAKEPKAVLHIDQLNVLIVPEKIGNPNGMQIMFEQNGYTRSLFVFSETGEDLIEWYTCLRSAKLNRLAIAYPATGIDELCQILSTDFVKEGWLNKAGPRANDAFRRRWVTLDKRKFMYYDDPLHPFPKGEVFVGSNEKMFYVSDGKDDDPVCAFTVHTPTRVFHFTADTEDIKKEWIAAFQSVINTPVTPKEQSSAANKKRNSVRHSMLMLLKKYLLWSTPDPAPAEEDSLKIAIKRIRKHLRQKVQKSQQQGMHDAA